MINIGTKVRYQCKMDCDTRHPDPDLGEVVGVGYHSPGISRDSYRVRWGDESETFEFIPFNCADFEISVYEDSEGSDETTEDA